MDFLANGWKSTLTVIMIYVPPFLLPFLLLGYVVMSLFRTMEVIRGFIPAAIRPRKEKATLTKRARQQKEKYH